jgi:hypothetical protein
MSILNLIWINININIMDMKRHMLICISIFMSMSKERDELVIEYEIIIKKIKWCSYNYKR